ncbi:hypothetical protein LTR95_010879 [Oleoguttula sp. CCFEE 5521]
MAPNGVELAMLVANGAFPGETIEANWGDWFKVSVTNGLAVEGTAIHWHGFYRLCPIAPGKTFTYRFRAELYGSSWWYGHYSAQYVNGLPGAIIVHGTAIFRRGDLRAALPTDVEQHGRGPNILANVDRPKKDHLINGKKDYPCSSTSLPCTSNAGLAASKFETNKKHRLRLINHAAEALLFFSIDGYEMTVIANDFVPVEPYQTDLVQMGVGQRTDIINARKSNAKESVYMGVMECPSGLGPASQTGCSLDTGVSIEAKAPIYYQDADTGNLPNTTSAIDGSRYLFSQNCSNTPLNVTVPSYATAVKQSDKTLNFLMTGQLQTKRVLSCDPILFEAKLGKNDSYIPERQVYDMRNATVLRIVLTSVGFPGSHPMHIHGHNMQVLAEGVGSWDGLTIVNHSNSQRHDTQIVRPNGCLVLQLELENPGVRAFHCHVARHVSEGMNINILERPADV